MKLYKYLYFFFYPNVKCSVTRVEDLTCSFISLLTNDRDADSSRMNYNPWHDMTSKFPALWSHVPRITQAWTPYITTIQVQRWTEERESQFMRICVSLISVDWNKLLPYIF